VFPEVLFNYSAQNLNNCNDDFMKKGDEKVMEPIYANI